MWRPRAVPQHIDDAQHKIAPGEEGRLDRIADLYYGDARLWWVIALASSIKHPQRDATLDRVLRIPARVTVKDLINARR